MYKIISSPDKTNSLDWKSRKSSSDALLENEVSIDRREYSPPKELARGIGFFEALKLPGVFLYSVVYICVKSALYGLLFWLPMYLKVEVGFKEVR